jgi:hypothetical protein
MPSVAATVIKAMEGARLRNMVNSPGDVKEGFLVNMKLRIRPSFMSGVLGSATPR